MIAQVIIEHRRSLDVKPPYPGSASESGDEFHIYGLPIIRPGAGCGANILTFSTQLTGIMINVERRIRLESRSDDISSATGFKRWWVTGLSLLRGSNWHPRRAEGKLRRRAAKGDVLDEVVDSLAMTPLDTSQAANDIQLLVLKKMTGIERLRIAMGLSEMVRKLAFARISLSAVYCPGDHYPKSLR